MRKKVLGTILVSPGKETAKMAVLKSMLPLPPQKKSPNSWISTEPTSLILLTDISGNEASIVELLIVSNGCYLQQAALLDGLP